MTAELHVDLGSHSQVELEGVGSGLLNVDSLVAFVRQGLAEHLDIVVLHVLIHLLANDAVDGVHLHGRAIHALNHAHGHLTRTEARHVSLLAIVFQCLLDSLLEIILFDGDGHQAIHLVSVLKCDIHLLICDLLFYILQFRGAKLLIFPRTT